MLRTSRRHGVRVAERHSTAGSRRRRGRSDRRHRGRGAAGRRRCCRRRARPSTRFRPAADRSGRSRCSRGRRPQFAGEPGARGGSGRGRHRGARRQHDGPAGRIALPLGVDPAVPVSTSASFTTGDATCAGALGRSPRRDRPGPRRRRCASHSRSIGPLSNSTPRDASAALAASASSTQDRQLEVEPARAPATTAGADQLRAAERLEQVDDRVLEPERHSVVILVDPRRSRRRFVERPDLQDPRRTARSLGRSSAMPSSAPLWVGVADQPALLRELIGGAGPRATPCPTGIRFEPTTAPRSR